MIDNIAEPAESVYSHGFISRPQSERIDVTFQSERIDATFQSERIDVTFQSERIDVTFQSERIDDVAFHG